MGHGVIEKGTISFPRPPRRERICSRGREKGSKTFPRSLETPENGAGVSRKRGRAAEPARWAEFQLLPPTQQVNPCRGDRSRGRKTWGETPNPAPDLPLRCRLTPRKRRSCPGSAPPGPSAWGADIAFLSEDEGRASAARAKLHCSTRNSPHWECSPLNRGYGVRFRCCDIITRWSSGRLADGPFSSKVPRTHLAARSASVIYTGASPVPISRTAPGHDTQETLPGERQRSQLRTEFDYAGAI